MSRRPAPRTAQGPQILGVGSLAAETRTYVPRVLDLYARLKEQFDAGAEIPVDLAQRDAHREGKTLMGGPR